MYKLIKKLNRIRKSEQELESAFNNLYFKKDVGWLTSDNVESFFDIDDELNSFKDSEIKNIFRNSILEFERIIAQKGIRKIISEKEFVDFMEKNYKVTDLNLFEMLEDSSFDITKGNELNDEEREEAFLYIFFSSRPLEKRSKLFIEYYDHIDFFVDLMTEIEERAYLQGFGSLKEFEPLMNELTKEKEQNISIINTKYGLGLRVNDVYYYGKEKTHAKRMTEDQAISKLGFVDVIKQHYNKVKKDFDRKRRVLLREFAKEGFSFKQLKDVNLYYRDSICVTAEDAINYIQDEKEKWSNFYRSNKNLCESWLKKSEINNFHLFETLCQEPTKLFFDEIVIEVDTDILKINYLDTGIKIDETKKYYFIENRYYNNLFSTYDVNPNKEEDKWYSLIDEELNVVKEIKSNSIKTFDKKELESLNVLH